MGGIGVSVHSSFRAGAHTGLSRAAMLLSPELAFKFKPTNHDHLGQTRKVTSHLAAWVLNALQYMPKQGLCAFA